MILRIDDDLEPVLLHTPDVKRTGTQLDRRRTGLCTWCSAIRASHLLCCSLPTKVRTYFMNSFVFFVFVFCSHAWRRLDEPELALAGAEQHPEGYRTKAPVALWGFPNKPEGLSPTTARAEEGQPSPLPPFFKYQVDACVRVCSVCLSVCGCMHVSGFV